MTDFKPTAGFPPAVESDWQALVERIVGREEPLRSLSSVTRDGLRVEPLYSQRNQGRNISGGRRGWQVLQRCDHPDPAEANRMALADLKGGADGLEVVLPGSCVAGGYGVAVETLDDFDRLFDGIDLERTPIRLDGGYEIRSAIALMAALIERRGCDPARIDVVGQSDPANGLFSDGRLAASFETTCDWGADVVHGLLARGLNMSLLIADGRSVHAGGGSEAQELAYIVADGVEHLRSLEQRGIAPDDAVRQIAFTLAADADQFMTVAKFRAFRLLWARVVELVGLPATPVRLNGETAWRMMARRDPWTNILRSTIAVAGAAIGGADTIVVLPFTSIIGLADHGARRLARNTQLVLLHEAGLAEVADPAAGSGYVEALTEGLAEASWELFRDMEKQGGLIASLRQGSFQAKVLETRRERLADVARRREPLVGVSEFAWLPEPPVRTLEVVPPVVRESGNPLSLPEPGHGERFQRLVEAAFEGASLADMYASRGTAWEHSASVPKLRLAEPFERLRAASDGFLDRTGKRPPVFLANLGSPSDHGGRSSWARRVFAAGGLDSDSDASFASVDEAIAGFRDSGAEIACICSSDEVYTELAAAAAHALKNAGAQAVYLVGHPGEPPDTLAEPGVDAHLHEGCDILEFLESVHARLGIGNLERGADDKR